MQSQSYKCKFLQKEQISSKFNHLANILIAISSLNWKDKKLRSVLFKNLWQSKVRKNISKCSNKTLIYKIYLTKSKMKAICWWKMNTQIILCKSWCKSVHPYKECSYWAVWNIILHKLLKTLSVLTLYKDYFNKY